MGRLWQFTRGLVERVKPMEAPSGNTDPRRRHRRRLVWNRAQFPPLLIERLLIEIEPLPAAAQFGL